MIETLHYLKDTKLWKLWHFLLVMGNAGFLSISRRKSSNVTKGSG